MPHLTLEYTANLATRAPDADLLLSLHRLLEGVAGVSIENCKSRWREVGDWVVGDGEETSAFVHLDIRILEGRPIEVQRALTQGALEMLRRHFLPAPAGANPQITVELQEIRRIAYAKDPPGTLSAPPGKQV